ncbi:MAG: helix-turn-helix domain-containing protein [Macromonas sp.]
MPTTAPATLTNSRSTSAERPLNVGTTSRKRGRPRDPNKLARVLEELSGDPAMFFEYGAPPYNLADLARRLEMDASNLRAYLLVLERDGLVVRERRHHQIWNAIARDHQDRMVLCFWNAATMARDRAAADAWNAGSSERAAGAYAAFDRMFQPQHAAPALTPRASDAIDVVARLVPDTPAIGG